LLGREVDVVVFAGAEKEAGLAVDGGVVVAAESEAILKRDAFGGVGGQGEGCENGECGEAALGEREWHGFRIQGIGYGVSGIGSGDEGLVIRRGRGPLRST
jgi:hypothetical protein